MRVLNFSDGFTSSEEPLLGTITANNLPVFESVEAFEEAKGENSEPGDIFQETTGDIKYFDGDSWQSIIDGTSLNSAIATVTAQIGELAEDLNLYVQNLEEDISTLETELNNHVDREDHVHGVVGNVVGDSDEQTLTKKTFADLTSFLSLLAFSISDNDTLGEKQTLSAPTKFITRLVGDLTSISGISEVAANQLCIYVNETGADILVENESPDAVESARIIVGTGSDLVFQNGASIWLVRDTSSNRNRIVGGAGSGSGTGLIVATLLKRDEIVGTQRAIGLSAFVLETNTSYRLYGGVENSDWVAENTYEDVILAADGALVPSQKTLDGIFTVKSTGGIRTMSGITQTNLLERSRITLIGSSNALPVILEPDANMVMNGSRIYLKNGMAISFIKLGTKLYQTSASF